ncbi:MAG: twin-arginine translocase subunit TatC [Chlorobiaceae bacterium]|nr:twin-arginine translocase subunit TatC [Chlorobiaceae bacterium]
MSNDSDNIIPAPDGNGQPAENMRQPEPLASDDVFATTDAPIVAENTTSISEPPPEQQVAPVGQDSGTSADQEEDQMSFLDHLEEIRWRLVRAGIFFLIATIGCGLYSDFLVNQVLIGPLKNSGPNIILQNLVPYGQISLYLQVVFFSGFVLSFPALVWQIWMFVEPGLHESERKASKFIIMFISVCFFIGIAFGYFVFLPISLKFFAGFGSPLIRNNIAVQDYVSFFLGTLLTAGLVFELPFISYVLSKIGLLTPAFMRFYRKHAVVVMLVIAAIVTPSTDMVTQMVIAVPMIILYEISIFISGRVQRNRNRELLNKTA